MISFAHTWQVGKRNRACRAQACLVPRRGPAGRRRAAKPASRAAAPARLHRRLGAPALRAVGALALLVGLAGVAGAAVARLAQPLDGTRSAVAETDLGNLVADAMRAAVNADFALVQSSALQAAHIPAGDLGEDEIRALLVFADDTITVLALDAAHLAEALERSVSMVPHPNKGFLQVSRLRLRFDPSRAPGARVVSIAVGASGPFDLAQGRRAPLPDAPLEPDRAYRVAVPESLAKGALGYFRVFNSAPRERTDITLLQAVSRFAAASTPVVARVEGRIQAGPRA